MTYTFDEAIEKIESITDELNIRQEVINDVVSVVEGLREEYAPTIEMTKLQHDVFADDMEDIATQEHLDLFITDVPGLGDMTVRKGLNAWLHPETIKIVDE
ncbi:hypothetical protein [Leuconostoc mesenteroides]|uniref:hypothetical protein n=1 Tax=Leuconostoc mesenteroides TaxID=1245 RepID=UPI00236097DD|nr:hypothetical protein [Leuconostoc mesenteroides]